MITIIIITIIIITIITIIIITIMITITIMVIIIPRQPNATHRNPSQSRAIWGSPGQS